VRRYLTISEAKSALARGKQIEQFLGSFYDGQDRAIRHAVIRPEGDRIIANVYECYEPTRADFFNVGEFQNVDPDENTEDFIFGSFEEAVSFLEYRNGLSSERFVNQGLVEEEYKDFRRVRR
jgi:hypothetical protein